MVMAELIEKSAAILTFCNGKYISNKNASINSNSNNNNHHSNNKTIGNISSSTSTLQQSLAKSLHLKMRPIRIMIIGQSSVGKSAMVVRFITHRFIGEYDPNLEKIYTYSTVIDNEIVQFEILDTAGQINDNYNLALEMNIRWADAFILMYSVTDKCSFDECSRLKFLINYNKRRRKIGTPSLHHHNSNKDKDNFNGNQGSINNNNNNNNNNISCNDNNNSGIGPFDVPVILVGNKMDQYGDRMITFEDGQKRFREICCTAFHEISVRESIDQVINVFRDAYHFWRVFTKFPKLKRSTSDVQHQPQQQITCTNIKCKYYINSSGESTEVTNDGGLRHSYLILDNQLKTMLINNSNERQNNNNNKLITTRENKNNFNETRKSTTLCTLHKQDKVADDQHQQQPDHLQIPFRERASTDGTLSSPRVRRWRYLPMDTTGIGQTSRCERRMSISMRGSTTNY